MRVMVRLFGKCNLKLALVKLLKECTGIGLKEAKDIADILCDNGYNEFEILPNKFSDLERGLKEIGDFTTSGNKEWLRESKILGLGLGEKSDYINFISEFISNSGTSFGSNSKELIDIIIGKLTKKHLKEVVNEINRIHDSNMQKINHKDS